VEMPTLCVPMKLRNFRAGIEGVISFLKRTFRMDRCNWSGLEPSATKAHAPVVRRLATPRVSRKRLFWDENYLNPRSRM
jgi:hypothetical protein